MQITTKQLSDTQAVLTVVADAAELKKIKEHVLRDLAKQVRVPGFRSGKVPPAVVEKNIDQATLQSEFLEHAINDLYPGAVEQAGLRPVARPEIEVKKFVPFETVEFEAKMSVIGEIKLADYKKIKLARKPVKSTDKDVDEVVKALLQRAAVPTDVDRAAQANDQAVIDFKGVDDKGETVNGADGTDYPLPLGSNTFIPGFEENVIGMKAGEEKAFTLKFPKDYGVKALANRDVTFTVTVKKVQELAEPVLDDKFAASVGPVKTVDELKADIKRELETEKQRQADLDYESELVKILADKSTLSVPQALIDEQIEHMLREVQQNLVYRGQTIQEFLEAEGKTEDEYKKDVLAPQAEERIKAGLVLAEVAEKEKIDINPQELDIRMQTLKGQYSDPQMQAELDKPETRREIASRMLSEKTVAQLASYAQQR